MKKIIGCCLIMGQALFATNIEGFYKVPNFLHFKGAYVYVFEYNQELFAYGVANIDNSPAKTDSCNPDKNLRNRSDKGVIFLRVSIKGDKFKDGFSYNFQNCSLYYTKGQILPNNDLHFDFSLDSRFLLSKGLVWKKLDNTQVEALNLKALPKDQILKQIKSFSL